MCARRTVLRYCLICTDLVILRMSEISHGVSDHIDKANAQVLYDV
jgi:hypothetical protein